MSRKRIQDNVQARVLLRSRRRCCICFGLNRDTSIKQGQIAHLDKNSGNNAEDNLAFLCLDHHDRYDSTTSQSKNFTMAEVKGFRAELDASIGSAFSSDVRFGEAAAASSGINGQYIRLGEGSSSAELTVRVLPNGEIRVIGEALWGTNREYGPNIGTLDFLADLQGNLAVFEDRLLGDDRPYIARLTFADGSLVVDEQNPIGYFGMNVSFAGTYAKAA
jgi:hypothetical protein